MSVTGAGEPVSQKAVLWEELRLIVRRHWWEFLAIALAVMLFFAWPRFTLPSLDDMVGVSLVMGGPWGGTGLSALLYYLVGMYAALTLWRDYPPDSRGHLYAQPISAATLSLLRVGIGGALLGLTLIVGLQGMLLIVTWGPIQIAEGELLFFGILPPQNWLIWIVGMLNIYLAGSTIALLSRTPARIGMLVLLGMMILWGLAVYLPAGIVRLPLAPLLPPSGLLGGLGITIWDAAGENLEPALAAPLMWFLILSAFTWLAARRAAGRPV